MRQIDKLIVQAILPPFLSALAVLTFVVFVREIGRLSELLITQNAAFDTILLIAAAILPNILIFSLPLSFLIGILIGLGGLSSESQIIALRACGIPLRRILLPILGSGILIGILTAALSTVILPMSNRAFVYLRDRISLRQAAAQIQPRVFNEEYSNIVFYVDDIAPDRQRLNRVFLSDSSDPQVPRTVLAREGSWVTDSQAYRLQLHLERGIIYEVDPGDPSRDKLSTFVATDIPIEIQRSGSASGEAAHRSRRVVEMTTSELWHGQFARQPGERLEQRIEFHRRLAIPFSVLGFSLLGLTLGISTKKGGRTSGFVLSLVLVLTFYVLLMNGIRLASVGKLPAPAGAWGASVILAAAGLLLLAGAEKGNWLGHWIASWRWRSRLAPVTHQLHLDAARTQILRIDDAIVQSTSRMMGLRFPKILDLYVSRGFLIYFLWSTVACISLFIILTLFDLLDDIIRNQTPTVYVVSYFFYLLPQILMLVVPMAVLLATLIHFGILEKASEVTALKAGGWSLYRISIPVFLLASVLCFGLYMVQDYVLPFANMRQDHLRNIIKGRPAQTSLRPQRKWIFGESNRVFNYDYFDASQNFFIGLNVFEIDLQALKVVRRIHADRAAIQGPSAWVLEMGWVRDFESSQNGFRRFERDRFPFPEQGTYFRKEIFEPKESSKLAYLELKNYISYLRKSGYDATELQVELHKKVSFPLSCVVMALLGIPFSFSMGRKGAFFGIALSISVAIMYWTVFSLFEKMGAYGMLMPVLAAWAPNILFGAAGLALLFTIRT